MSSPGSNIDVAVPQVVVVETPARPHVEVETPPNVVVQPVATGIPGRTGPQGPQGPQGPAGHTEVLVRNSTGATIYKGTVVRETGVIGSGVESVTTIDLAFAGDIHRSAIGILTADLAPGEDGWAISRGVLTEVNTLGFAEGDVVYLSGAGSMTAEKPSTGIFQVVGRILSAGASGSLYVLLGPPADAGEVGPSGPQGPTGAKGDRGPHRFYGEGPPSTIIGASPGDEYVDALTGDLYILQ